MSVIAMIGKATQFSSPQSLPYRELFETRLTQSLNASFATRLKPEEIIWNRIVDLLRRRE